jgi:hypothetical protein
MHGVGVDGGGSGGDDDERRPTIENTLVQRADLTDHLMWQLRLSTLSDADKEIGGLIVGNLDTDGYLMASVDELAFLANVGRTSSGSACRVACRSSIRPASRRRASPTACWRSCGSSASTSTRCQPASCATTWSCSKAIASTASLASWA